MLRNYFTIALRNLRKHPAFTLINILGLSLGTTCCLLIFLLLRNELSFDRFFAKSEQIYRLASVFKKEDDLNFNANTPYPLAKAIRTDFPELENVTQIHYSFGKLVTVGTDRYHELNIVYADSLFLSVFDYPWISGDAKYALAQPNSAVLTETIAKKYFKGEEALGKIIELDNSIPFKVTGVIKDVPKNTHLPFSMLVSYSAYKDRSMDRWDYINHGMTYVVLPKNMTPKQIVNQLPAFVAKHLGEELAIHRSFELQPIDDIRFDTRFATTNPADTVSKNTLWTLTCIGVLILLIACVNFINLTTAQAIKRGREVGMRKVLGSTKTQLICQFLNETLLLTTFAMILSILFTFLSIPKINEFLEFTELRFNLDSYLILFLLFITLLVGVLSGLYPALVLASYKPVVALKNNFDSITKQRSYFSLGKGTVVFQFVAAQVLIIGTWVVSSQMHYFRQKDLGFDKEAIVNFHLPSHDVQKLTLVRNELLRHPQISAVSFGKGAPTSEDIGFGTKLSVEGRDGLDILVKATDAYYQQMYDLDMLAGQWLPDREVKNGIYDFVINETALRKMGYSKPEEAIGGTVKIWLWEPFEGTIVGVAKDFHLTSLKEEIAPLAMMNLPEAFSQAGIKQSGQDIKETLGYTEKVFKAVFPQDLFSYSFLNESIASLYAREEKIDLLFKIFAGMAIFIACLGLLGLSAFTAVRRTKEIGIRKVLGASIFQIVLLLCSQFALMVLIAFLIATPIAWYGMNKWLESFAYHIKIDPSMLVGAGFVVLLSALFTVSFQSIKAALANPIKSLRNE